MALFGLGKKREKQPISPTARLPIDLVIQMRQQGFSNNQIVQSLQRQNYSTTQIFDAMSQADITSGMPQHPPEPPTPAPPQEAQPPGPPPLPPVQPAQYVQEMPPIPPPEEYPALQYPAPRTEIPSEQIEEVAEAIIEEKWKELSKGVQKIIDWKNETETKINKIVEELKILKKNYDDLHKGVLGKLSEYDQGIKEVGTDIKAMESVFKKIIPTFTENVSELSRITKTMKKKK